MTDSLQRAIVRELERAHPGPVTFRSLRSLVPDEYARDDVREALTRLREAGRVTEIRERGMVRYRLVDAPD